MTHETPSRRCSGRFETIRILFRLLLASHICQERLKDDEELNKLHSPAGLRGVELLDTPISNKGTDFDDVEDSYAAAISCAA